MNYKNTENNSQNTASPNIKKDSKLSNSNLANEVTNYFLNGPGIAPAHLSLTLEPNSGSSGTSRADAIRKRINDTLNTVLQNKNNSTASQNRLSTNLSNESSSVGGFTSLNNNKISTNLNVYHRPLASKPPLHTTANNNSTPVYQYSNSIANLPKTSNPFMSNSKFLNQFSNTNVNTTNSHSSSSKRYRNQSTRKYVKSGNFSRQKLLERKLLNQGHPTRIQPNILPHPASETSTTSYSKEPNASPHTQSQASRTGVNMIKIPHLIPSANTSLFPYGTLSTNNQPTSYLKDSQEIERNRELKVRLQKTLEIEQQTISHPTYLVPFSSKRDAIERLLPYHLYQYPDLPNPHRSNLQLISTTSAIEETLPRIQDKLNSIITDEYYQSPLESQSHDVQLNRLLNSTRQQ